MKISTKGRYAVEALLCMALKAENECVSIKEISNETQISDKYLEQIFFTLRKIGILATKRGPKGGYYIVNKLCEITVGDVLRAVENDIIPVACIKNPEKCVSGISNICTTRRVWSDISTVIDNNINSMTFENLKKEYMDGDDF